jgi:hypothetical protein
VFIAVTGAVSAAAVLLSVLTGAWDPVFVG